MITQKLIDHYKKYKYCVIKNFISDDKSNHLINVFNGGSRPHGSRMPLMHYFREISSIADPLLYHVSKDVCQTRIEILIKSNELRVPYDLRDLKNPNIALKIMDETGGWSRFMNYKDENQEFASHKDAIGEVMCILHLSTYGINYKGGLHIVKPDDEVICLDKKHSLSKNDLVIVDANYYEHWVRVSDIVDETGRLTYFINLNPNSKEGVIVNDDQPNKIH